MEQKPRARTVASLIALLSLALLTVLSLWAVGPPAPRGADVATGEFSAGRAFAHVERVGSQVHVAGSAAADDVRGYLEATLRGLGLQTEVQEAVGASDALGGFAMARVRNVVAVLPGTAGAAAGRVFLVAHYDSVQVSYGGNDDGAGVATLLETARALTAGATLRNDIVFVFTDAEEACLCGAEAFVSQHRLAAGGGVVLNFEARGSGGPAIMFETSRGNADVVDVYGAAAAHPVGTSFAVEVYRILPNDTDFTPFREAGRFTGLNSAYIDGSAAYHTPEDKPSYMDQASLQHHGDNALSLARAFGDSDLGALGTASAGDATYFPALGLLVRYPGWLVWPLAVIALAAVGLLGFLARRRGAASRSQVFAGFGLALIPLLLAAVAAQLLWVALVALRPGYAEMIDPWRPGWFRAGVVALVATIVLTWYGMLRRRIGPWPLAIGALGWLAVLGLVLAAATPGGSYLAAVPALFGAVAAIGALLTRHPVASLAAVTVGGAVAVLILAPTVLLFFPALGLATGGAVAFFAAMLGLALLPVLDYLYPALGAVPRSGAGPDADAEADADAATGAAPRRAGWSWAPALTAGALAVACLLAGLAVDRFDSAHPAPTQLMYALDADTGQAKWVSAEADPSEWTSQYVTAREDLGDLYPVLGDDLATGPAEAASLAAPALTVVADSTTSGQRTLTVNVRPQRAAVRLVYVGVRGDARVQSATVEGRPVTIAAADSAGFGVLFHAPPAQGVTMTFVLAQTGPVTLRALDGTDGLTELPGFRPRPPAVGIEGSHDSELVVVAKTYTV